MKKKKLNNSIKKIKKSLKILFFITATFTILRTNDYLFSRKIKEVLPLKINTNNYNNKYHISYFNSSEYKYNFQKVFENRKIYDINYSYIPYLNVDKKISYKENAEKIYKLTGILNITKLDYFYNKIEINTKDLNHIHLTIGLDNKYIPLTLVALASILP
jgi:hypothetical protein